MEVDPIIRSNNDKLSSKEDVFRVSLKAGGFGIFVSKGVLISLNADSIVCIVEVFLRIFQ